MTDLKTRAASIIEELIQGEVTSPEVLPFVIEVSAISSNISPREAGYMLGDLAERLGVSVRCDINGTTVTAQPVSVERI